MAIKRRDVLLYRLLPFGTVALLITASVLIAIFASAWLGSATLAATLGSTILAYLRSQPRD